MSRIRSIRHHRCQSRAARRRPALLIWRERTHTRSRRQGLAIVDMSVPSTCVSMNFSMTAPAGRRTRCRRCVDQRFAVRLCGGRTGGLKVLQLTISCEQHKFTGSSPLPKPELIAYYPHTVAGARVVRRVRPRPCSRRVGHQIAVFGRRGAGPLSLQDSQRLYLNRTARHGSSKRQRQPRTAGLRVWPPLAPALAPPLSWASRSQLRHSAKQARRCLPATDRHLGVASCASSVCHGAVQRRESVAHAHKLSL